MTETAHTAIGRSSPGLRYRDVGAAVRWLCQAFGFAKLSVVSGPDGSVSYAELGYGDTIMMLGAVQGFEIDQYMAQPDDIGGAETQCCYFVVKDIEDHYARACDAGGEIVIGIKTHDNGDKIYTCRDPEGHLWTFGTYDPWVLHAPPREAAMAPIVPKSQSGAMASIPTRLIAGLSLATVISGLSALWLYGQLWSTAREAVAAPALVLGPELARAIKKERRRLMFERTVRRKAERTSLAAREEAARERTLRVSAQVQAKVLAERLALAVRKNESALDAAIASRNAESQENLRLAEKIKQELEVERRAKQEAQRVAALAESRLSAAEAARTAAEQRAKEAEARTPDGDVQAKLEQVEAARKAAERAAKEAEARVAFVSERAKKSTEEALANIRKELEGEQAARVAAEAAAKEAQEELARERSSKQAAWRTVYELKRRLAKAQGVPISGATVSSGSAPKKKYKAAPKSEPGVGQWNLYSGPVFVKQ